MDIQEVCAVGLAGGMSGQRKGQIGGRDAVPVITDPDQAFAAVGHVNHDARAASVNGVFHQLFDRRGGPFYDFAGRNPIDCRLIQLPDFRNICADMGGRLSHAAISSMAQRDSTTANQLAPANPSG